MSTFICLGKNCAVIRDILLDMGWTEVETGNSWDLKWAGKPTRVDGLFGHAPRTQMVNHFRGSGELDSKATFMENLQWCQHCSSAFFPRSYDLRVSTELHKFIWDLFEVRAKTLVDCDTAEKLLSRVGSETLDLCNHEYNEIFRERRGPHEDIPHWMEATARPFIEQAFEACSRCVKCRAQRAGANVRSRASANAEKIQKSGQLGTATAGASVSSTLSASTKALKHEKPVSAASVAASSSPARNKSPKRKSVARPSTSNRPSILNRSSSNRPSTSSASTCATSSNGNPVFHSATPTTSPTTTRTSSTPPSIAATPPTPASVTSPAPVHITPIGTRSRSDTATCFTPVGSTNANKCSYTPAGGFRISHHRQRSAPNRRQTQIIAPRSGGRSSTSHSPIRARGGESQTPLSPVSKRARAWRPVPAALKTINFLLPGTSLTMVNRDPTTSAVSSPHRKSGSIVLKPRMFTMTSDIQSNESAMSSTRNNGTGTSSTSAIASSSSQMNPETTSGESRKRATEPSPISARPPKPVSRVITRAVFRDGGESAKLVADHRGLGDGAIADGGTQENKEKNSGGKDEEEEDWHVPRTFEESLVKFTGPQRLLAGLHNAWIFKNPHMSRGRGLTLYTADRCIKTLLEEARSRICKSQKYFCVAQKYMEQPYTVPLPPDGLQVKVDLRLWVLVISWNPLQAYVYEEPYFRLATKPFDFPRSPKGRADPKAHLTNRTIQILDWGELKEDPSSMWPLSDFLNHLDHSHPKGRRVWEEKTWPKMLDGVRCALVATQDAIVAQHEIYMQKVASKRVPLDGPRAFEMYGFDFALDRDLNPWVLEANVSPDLLPDAGATLKAWSKQACKELLTLVVDPQAITLDDVNEDDLPWVERLDACGSTTCYSHNAISQVPKSLVSGLATTYTAWKLFLRLPKVPENILVESWTKRKRALWAQRSTGKSHEQVIREMLLGLNSRSRSPLKTKNTFSLPSLAKKSFPGPAVRA
eukprot:GEMP01002700.1.p1 GENE.GEMP01002700.1~~GEMP01002700.1.p1  ORF type:complete len:988 (+),score=176.56 GEMP01002700.1:146-3109(+)